MQMGVDLQRAMVAPLHPLHLSKEVPVHCQISQSSLDD